MARIVPVAAAQDPELRPSFAHVEDAIDRWIDRAKLVA